MNPMDLFNRNGGFPYNKMPHQQFAPEYLHEIKSMVKQYQSVLTEDFWENINGLSNNKKDIQILPAEIWEDDEHVYLSIVAPGLTDISHAKIFFQNDQVLTLKIMSHTIKPEGATTLIRSEVPRHSYEREIYLQESVVTSDYAVSHERGVLTYTFKKVKDELEIPFDF